ncbi:hypothetical protein LXA43DRAFT_1066363 [Ganoderma leucocontextum]|nr:hypothetical protein LXA43DRAFT_1066363 [Ganoderma leucocontextum]
MPQKSVNIMARHKTQCSHSLSNQMVLPTEGCDRITIHIVWGWLAALSSPMVEQSDMTPEQRTFLLAIACAYSAFLDVQPGVRTRDFDEFTRRLRTLARSLDPLTSTEEGLQAIKTWVEARLLASAFAPLRDDTFEVPERVASSEPRQKDLITSLVAMLTPDLRDTLEGLGDCVSSPSSSPSANVADGPGTSTLRARKDRRRCAKQRAAMGTPSNVPTSGAPIAQSQSNATLDPGRATPSPIATNNTDPATAAPGLPAPGLPTAPTTAVLPLAVPTGSEVDTATPNPTSGTPTCTATAGHAVPEGTPGRSPVIPLLNLLTVSSGYCRATVEDASDDESADESNLDSFPATLCTVTDSSDFEEGDSDDADSDESVWPL